MDELGALCIIVVVLYISYLVIQWLDKKEFK